MRMITALFGAFLIFGCTAPQPEILFSTKDTGVAMIFRIDQADSVTLVSSGSSKALNPALSPTGTQVAYLSEEMGNWDIRVKNLVTGVDSNFTNSPELDAAPAWSSDGKLLAYMSGKAGNRDIFILNTESGERHQATFNPAIDADPVFHESDPNTLFFTSLRNRYENVYKLNIRDSLVTELSDPLFSNSKHAMIPGTNSISYVQTDAINFALIRCDVESGERTPLLNTEIEIKSYEWSSTGLLAIAFQSSIAIYEYESGLDFLFELELAENPAWSKDGKTLYYNTKGLDKSQIVALDMETDQYQYRTPEGFNAFDPIPIE